MNDGHSARQGPWDGKLMRANYVCGLHAVLLMPSRQPGLNTLPTMQLLPGCTPVQEYCQYHTTLCLPVKHTHTAPQSMRKKASPTHQQAPKPQQT